MTVVLWGLVIYKLVSIKPQPWPKLEVERPRKVARPRRESMPYKHGMVILDEDGNTLVIQDQPYTGPPIPISQGSQRRPRRTRGDRFIFDLNGVDISPLVDGQRVVYQRNLGWRTEEIIAHPWAPEEEFNQAWNNGLQHYSRP